MHDLKERTATSKLNGVNVRKPTGKAPWPVVLVEGNEKSGKTFAAAVFSGSDKLGATYWLDIGEGSGDEYGAVPGANYWLMTHNGTWDSIMAAVLAAKKEAIRASEAGEKPIALVIDSMTSVWFMISEWVYGRAKIAPQNSRKGPNDEITISSNFWTDGNKRHQRLMNHLIDFPGPVIITARGRETLAVDENGRPQKDERGKVMKTYKVEAQKNVSFDANILVRMTRGQKPLLIGMRAANEAISMSPEDSEPVVLEKFDLETLIFDVFRCDPATAKTRDFVPLDGAAELNPNGYRDRALAAVGDREELLKIWHEAGQVGVLDLEVVNETGDEELLKDLVKRLGQDKFEKKTDEAEEGEGA